MKYTVEEVRAHAAILRDWRNGFDPGVGNDDAAGMLDAHADLLERREAGLTTDVVNAALKEFRRWADSEDTVAMDAALHLVWPVPINGRAEAKLSERKTVHEWLNDLHIEREELGKPLCLLRRLRILCDRYQGTCDQLPAQAGHVVTQSMVHEAMAHVPFGLSFPARCEWIANYLNAAPSTPKGESHE
jgi:hypothetical protein